MHQQFGEVHVDPKHQVRGSLEVQTQAESCWHDPFGLHELQFLVQKVMQVKPLRNAALAKFGTAEQPPDQRIHLRNGAMDLGHGPMALHPLLQDRDIGPVHEGGQ